MHILEMESEKNAETLKKGFLESNSIQNEIFCTEIREEGNPDCLSNLSEKCVVDAYSGRNELSNVELARIFGNGSVEECMVDDGISVNNRMNEGSMHGYPNENSTVSMHCNDILSSCNLFHDEKIEEHMEEGNDVLHPHEPGSPTKLEVSGNSINLFVEVFGPLDGISGSDDSLDHPVECKSEESNFNQEFALQENGTLSTGITDLSAKYEGKGIIGEQEFTFHGGDLVWIKTRTQLWWPGMISANSDASNGSYLVKYYGSASLIWCDKADLKPFPEYVEQMSGQNNSRNFLGSVEKALCEIGQRVKLKMTCPCFLKDSHSHNSELSVRKKEENSLLVQNVSKFEDLSLSQFDPATFIADIRDLAWSIRVPGKVELMVMKNRLSPFYRSIGHCELPLQLLRSCNDAAENTQEHLTSDIKDKNHYKVSADGRDSVEAHDDKLTRTRRKRKNHSDGSVLDDKITSSAKSLDSRERKKSKYLSYPYIEDVNQAREKEDNMQRGKPLKGLHIVSKEDDISASSAELLAELCSSARDCSYISRSKYSDSLERFYCSFRKFAFLDADIASKVEAEDLLEGSKVVKNSKKQRANLAYVKESLENADGDKSSVVGNQKPKENVIRRRAKKKEEQVTDSENHEVNLASGRLENADIDNVQAKEKSVCENRKKEKFILPASVECMQNYFGMGTNIYPKSSWMMSFQQACSTLFKSSNTPQESSRLTPGLADTSSKSYTPGLADTNSMPILPDLNGNQPGFTIDHIPVGVPLANLVNPMPGTPANLVNPLPGTPANLVNPLPGTPANLVNPLLGTPANLVNPLPGTPANLVNPLPGTPANLVNPLPGTPANLVNHLPGTPANLVNPLPEQRNEGLVSPTINGVHQMDVVSLSSSKDGPMTFQNTPLSNNGVDGAYECLIGDFRTQPPDPMAMSTSVTSFVPPSLKMGDLLSAFKPKPKKRKRDEACQIALGIPDLNGNVLDTSPSGTSMPEGSHIPPEGEPQKRRRHRYASGESDAAPGGNLLLNFSPGCVPSKETLVATFSRFGLLKESELEILSDDSVRVVYERSSDARFASRSLERSHNFGESLISVKLDCYIPDPPKIKKIKNLPLRTFVPVGAHSDRTKLGEAVDIAFIKQNVEMMKSTLEKAGDNLPPEARAKLENEIKAFLNKISSVAGSSSS